MGKQWKQWLTSFWGGSKITADGDCSHEIKRHLLLGRRVMINLDSMLKSRDITLPTKVRLVKAMVFPVVELEYKKTWTLKNWCFWTIVLGKTLEVPWTARRSNQSILKEFSPGISVEGMMLKLKLQYFATSCEELTHWKRLLCWEGLWAGGEGDDRGWDGWMASLTRRIESEWWTGRPGVLQFMGSQRVGHNWAPELRMKK